MRKEPSSGRADPFVPADEYIVVCDELAFAITREEIVDGLIEDREALGSILYGLLLQVAKARQAKAGRSAPVFGGKAPMAGGGDESSDMVSKEEG